MQWLSTHELQQLNLINATPGRRMASWAARTRSSTPSQQWQTCIVHAGGASTNNKPDGPAQPSSRTMAKSKRACAMAQHDEPSHKKGRCKPATLHGFQISQLTCRLRHGLACADNGGWSAFERGYLAASNTSAALPAHAAAATTKPAAMSQ